MPRKNTPSTTRPDIAAPALLSFLKQVSVEPGWDEKRLRQVLGVDQSAAAQIVATLEMLGYAEAVGGKRGEWRNTEAGNRVSGAKPARFNRDSVIEALQELRNRAANLNADPASPFHITELIAFGDFLDEHAKAQPADVGVSLTPTQKGVDRASAVEHKNEEYVLAGLKAKSALLHLQIMEEWMRRRSHEDLLKA